MTRVVVAAAYGGPEGLSVVDGPERAPGPGEVLLEVRAAGVNPVDWKVYAGGDPARLPLRLGSVSVELVPDRGRIVTIAAFGRAGELGLRRIGGGPGADPGTETRNAARLELAKLADDGALTVVVEGVFPLDLAAEAHRQGRRGHTHGKLVLVP